MVFSPSHSGQLKTSGQTSLEVYGTVLAAVTHSKAAGVTQGLGGTALMDDSGEAGDQWSLHSWRPEHVSGRQVGDVVGHLHGRSSQWNVAERFDLAFTFGQQVKQERPLSKAPASKLIILSRYEQ